MFSLINRPIHKFINKLDIHSVDVIKKSAASTIVKLAGMVIGLVVSIALGRILGADGLGIINLSTRIVTVLIAIGLIGLQQVIVKEVATARSSNNLEHIGNVMNTTYLLAGGVGTFFSISFILATPWIAENIFKEPNLTKPLAIALAVMTPQIFSRIFSSALIGYQKIWQSSLVDKTLSFGIIGFLLLITWLLKIKITVNLVALFYAIGRITTTISIGIYWKKLFKSLHKRRIIAKKLLQTSLPLLIVSLSTIIMANTDVIFLGWIGNSTDVGLYTVAAQLALLTSFFLQVTNASVAPKIASLYEQSKIPELEKMIHRVTSGLFVIGLLTLVTYVLLGKYILTIWGNEFKQAYWILVILSTGQFINLGTGAVGLLLVMTGHERIQSRISLTFVLFNLLLNYFMIRLYGATGAAIATAITTAGDNITRMVAAKIKIGISTISL